MLTNEQIKKFQALYKKRFGVEIGEEEAGEKGKKLMRLIELIARPDARSEDAAKPSQKDKPHEA
jgi:hypothetical protein